MTYCTVTSSRNSRLISIVTTFALFVCLGLLMVGVIPSLDFAKQTMQTVTQAVSNAVR